MISGLFRIAPQFDWYGLTMLGFLFLSVFVIGFRFIVLTEGKKNSRIMRMTGIVLLAVLTAESIVFFQFTVVAGFLCVAGLFLLASLQNKLKLSEFIIVWILLLLGGMVRIKVLYMSVPLALFVMYIKTKQMIIKEKTPKGMAAWLKELKSQHLFVLKALLIVSVCILSVMSVRLVEKNAYSDPVWKKYDDYLHARSQIMDYYEWPVYEGNEEFWKSLDISEEEHNVLTRMYGILPDVNEEKIIEIAEYSKQVYWEKTTAKEQLARMMDLFLKAVQSEKCRIPNIMLVLAFVSLFIYGHDSGKKNIILGILIEVAILVYLLYQGRLPDRIIIIYDLQCILTIYGLRLTGQKQDQETKMNYRIIMLFLCIVSLAFMSIQVYGEVKQYRDKMSLYNQTMSYVDKNPEKIFVVPTNTVTTVKQFTISKKTDNHNTVGTYGWSVYSPWNESHYKRLGLSRERHILLDPNVYFLTKSKAHANRINKYYLCEGLIDNKYIIVDQGFIIVDENPLLCIKWDPAVHEDGIKLEATRNEKNH